MYSTIGIGGRSDYGIVRGHGGTRLARLDQAGLRVVAHAGPIQAVQIQRRVYHGGVVQHPQSLRRLHLLGSIARGLSLSVAGHEGGGAHRIVQVEVVAQECGGQYIVGLIALKLLLLAFIDDVRVHVERGILRGTTAAHWRHIAVHVLRGFARHGCRQEGSSSRGFPRNGSSLTAHMVLRQRGVYQSCLKVRIEEIAVAAAAIAQIPRLIGGYGCHGGHHFGTAHHHHIRIVQLILAAGGGQLILVAHRPAVRDLALLVMAMAVLPRLGGRLVGVRRHVHLGQRDLVVHQLS